MDTNNKTYKVEDTPLEKPTVQTDKGHGFCVCCEQEVGDTRMGWCFTCADLQAILIENHDMYDRSVEDWSMSEKLAYIIRTTLKNKTP